MGRHSFTFDFVENEVRKKNFGILSTVDSKNSAHSTGILYAVSPHSSKFCFYLLTDRKYKKVRNIRRNPAVSFVIPFPHYYLRFVPSSCVQLQGTARIVPFNTFEAQEVFKRGRILKTMLKQAKDPLMRRRMVFIKINPRERIFCYGLGMGIMELRKHIESGSYTIKIPADRL
jgi:nitroimidazol reductase NimA-like FMN-containing flavoprotein (pyridoxamine 5'-phosphate oxidase superfamily)